MKEDINGGGNAQIPAKNLKTPHEGPTVRVKLGRGGVEQLPLEGSEREMQAHPFEYHLVEEEERTSPGGPRVHTNGYPGFHTTYQDVEVMSFVECVKVVKRGVPPVGLHVVKGV